MSNWNCFLIAIGSYITGIGVGLILAGIFGFGKGRR